MKKIIHYFETESGKAAKNVFVSLGAAVVLLGALFKLMHWPGASLMLIVGMGTEVLLFAFFAILPPHKDYYWEKIYPGLDINPEIEHGSAGVAHQGSAVEQIDKGLQDAEVGPEIIERLGSNLKKLGDQMGKLGDMSDAASASNSFANNANAASETLAGMKDAYEKAIAAAGELAATGQDASEYKDQVSQFSKNLAQLNELYEIQIQDAKGLGKFYESVNDVAANLEAAVEDTRRYKEEVSKLNDNLTSLNSVYGNMLSAMKA